MYLIKRTPRQNGGRTCPETRPLYRSRAPAGKEERRKAVGTAESSVNQGSDQARQEPSIKDAVQGSEGSVVNRKTESSIWRGGGCAREAFAPVSPASTERLSAAMRAGVSLVAASAAKRVRLQWGNVEKAQLP
ncbi:hypothetical protein TNCV_3180561 [Trichonephila clavipes]|nr:hypothetical protein TNCV_3180561 [Trichonephila clavipes]